jgi:hypothetical protein
MFCTGPGSVSTYVTTVLTDDSFSVYTALEYICRTVQYNAGNTNYHLHDLILLLQLQMVLGSVLRRIV